MARKKTKKTYRRRRMSGVGSKLNVTSIATTIGGALVGVAGAGYINKMLFANTADAKKKQMYTTLLPVALGIATPMLFKGKKWAEYAGAGMIAYGGSKFLSKQGLIAGDEDSFEVSVGADDFAMSGDDMVSTIAGDDDYAMSGDDMVSTLAGLDDDGE
jgi:hypothetical protein